MKTFSKVAVAFGLVALMSAPAWAQGRGGFGGGFGGPGMLLSNKGVQQEIKATDEQVSKLNTLSEETRTKMTALREKFADVPQEERGEKMRTEMAPINADVEKSLATILKPEQVKRFHQIQRQTAGVNAFAQPRVAEELKLTDDQKAKIREINTELQTSTREAFTSAGQDNREEAMKKITDLRKDAMAKAQALLTDDQKKAWKDMTGEPYEVKFERPAGR